MADRLRRLRSRADRARIRLAAAAAGPALRADGAPAPERRARGVGPGAARLRPSACARPPCPRADGARPAGVARHVLRVARAAGLRLRASPRDHGAPRRAPDLPRRRCALLVAGCARA